MNSKFLITILVILFLALGAFSYFTVSNKSVTSKSYEREITKVETISKSDDVDTIEEDLSATDLDDLDKELSSIDAELN